MGYLTSKKLIREFVQDSPVTGYLDCIQYLEKTYHFVKDRKPGYSYIQFAVDLGFSATNVMHQIIRGYRKLTLKTAKKIALGLHLKGAQKKYFETLVEYRNETSGIKRDEIFGRLVEIKKDVLAKPHDKKWLDFFSIWYHPIVLEVLQLDQTKNDPKWVAAKVHPQITETQAQESMDLLQELDLIEWNDERQAFESKAASISSGHEVTGIGFIRYHQRMIELAKDSITRVSADNRDISSITFSCDQESLKDVKKMIHEFNENLQKHLEAVTKKDKVVQLNVQLFPVSTMFDKT
ncbi:TIGR02147 family protein [Pseudobacteriovorax antillogorgiicola]|uniref:TIGR02147 family protein n=1 Tax=Pseudobacteriovorax antillogorgiicola TaxID=1513793 RepID=A0A1Y6BRM5_9BACT|nr:TIGR02147 family protein [Pseudobacteriovorax antillogorgiicola]TCS54621.1 uncharacterized protein (TIGR02147 family) [Pseudobacteriovorax antillogorgiicola]SMF17375.1 TIGR02147 family protein [Pseudobacteriovorax antillogorgiicola]